MRIALAFALIPFSAPAASLGGAVVDLTGAYIAKAAVELDSGTKKYQTQTDDAGAFQFSNLPSGEYALTLRMPGFARRTIKSIGLVEHEEKRLPDVPLDVAVCGGPLSRDFVLLPPGEPFGRLSGRVVPPVGEVEVMLICRTFRACGSTKTDANGRFSFDMLSGGVYGLNFRRAGFYPENATGYSYYVNAGWESVYDPKQLDRCSNCDPKLRPPPPIHYCE